MRRQGYRINGVRGGETGSSVATGDIDGRCGTDLLIGAYDRLKGFVILDECPAPP